MSESFNPPGWPRPKGYSNAISASGRMVFEYPLGRGRWGGMKRKNLRPMILLVKRGNRF